MNITLKKIIVYSVLLSSIFISGCVIYTKPSFHGKVIDSETKEPIEGAVAMATYYKASPSIMGRVTKLLDVQKASTNKDGYFKIPSYFTFTWPYFWQEETIFLIEKDGYGSSGHRLSSAQLSLEIYFNSEIGIEKKLIFYNGWKILKMGIVELPSDQTIKNAENAPIDNDGESQYIINSCLRNLKGGAYRLSDICQEVNVDIKRRQLLRSSDKTSNIYKALEAMKIETIIKDGNIYILKEKDETAK